MPLKLYLIIFTVIASSHVKGQSCQSLGDPVINIDFGAGQNPGPMCPALTSAYTYLNTDCPYDGTYAVRNRTEACSDNTWYSMDSDHTGNPNGYFLLVNAANNPGVMFRTSVVNMCAFTTYRLSAWFMNILRPQNSCSVVNNPDLSFIVSNSSGGIIDSLRFTIPVSTTALWREYELNFITPPNMGDLVIEIRTNSPGGCGNDFAIDDIQLRSCARSIESSIQGVSTDTVAICEGLTNSFTLETNASAGFSHPVYQWQRSVDHGPWQHLSGENSPTLNVTVNSNQQPSILGYRALVAENGNLGSAYCTVPGPELNIQVIARPTLNLRSNQPVCEEQTLLLQSGAGFSEQWQGPHGYSATGTDVAIPNIMLADSGWYIVRATNPAGCTNADSVYVDVHPAVHGHISTTEEKICADDVVVVQVGGGSVIEWSPSLNVHVAATGRYEINPSVTTGYIAVISNGGFCKDTVSLFVQVTPHPIADAGPDRVRIGYEPVQLLGTSNDPGFIINWSPASSLQNAQSLHPMASPSQDQEYVLTLYSPQGCGTDSDTVKISIFKDLYIPNAFTPNGDGINDCWRIAGLAAFNNYRVTIYDRWSNVIYDVTDFSKGWDGTLKGIPLQTGTYGYFISLDNKPPRKGTVTLIR
jgi:gliding motility-associated-like protein